LPQGLVQSLIQIPKWALGLDFCGTFIAAGFRAQAERGGLAA
jgi:hypothetical protein